MVKMIFFFFLSKGIVIYYCMFCDTIGGRIRLILPHPPLCFGSQNEPDEVRLGGSGLLLRYRTCKNILLTVSRIREKMETRPFCRSRNGSKNLPLRSYPYTRVSLRTDSVRNPFGATAYEYLRTSTYLRCGGA